MGGYIDTVLPEQNQPTVYTEILTQHTANGVPTSSWRSLVNVGLSLTQYVSEAFTTAANLARTVFRGMFVDSIQEDANAATDATTLAQITAAANAFAQSQYQETLQPATLALLRVELQSVSNATYNFTAGDVLAGTPSTTSSLIYTLTENIQLGPIGRIVALFQAQSPGSVYNLASDAPFELKTTFTGVTASVPSTGARRTFGTGNSAFNLHAGSNEEEGGLEVAVRFIVDGPSVATLTFSQSNIGTQTVLVAHMRSDAGSAPLTTAAELVAAIVNSGGGGATRFVIAGASLPDGSTGTGVVAIVSSPTALPRADGPIQEAGQDTETAIDLTNRIIAKWDALSVGTGTDDALYYWGTKAPDGYTASPVAQIQVLNARKSDGTTKGGWITVLVSGELGPLSGADLAAVDANFYNPRKFAAFAKLVTLNATAVPITVTADVSYLKSAKLTDSDISGGIASAFLALQRRLTMGVQTIDEALVKATIFEGSTAIWGVSMSSPAAPTTLAWNERAEFDITGFTYTQVDP